MIEMNEPQVWTLIGVFAASMAAMITLVLSTIRATLGTVRAEIGTVRAEIGTVRAEIGEVRADMRGEMIQLRAEVKAEVKEQVKEQVRAEIAPLRRDLDALYRHIFGAPPEHGPAAS
ncbi:hypothetical protein N8K70_02185 [Microbacterium betulae]|uniref:DUF2746 domain-containing protein n=1 Tax=Microbacterium betulae TaxID=2981139 RepID=A0AA97FH80_9MICO|nr:hypothetical protein [Microbacterium sp. AB]WOF23511.1 hypothetical protein N8K70_02185 [Microbacterium sp. AB]